MIAAAAEAGNESNVVPLAIITLVGTVITAIIALIGTIISKRSGASQASAEELAEVKQALTDHVMWEMQQKYHPVPPPPPPWDGVERRQRQLPPPGV